MTSLPEIFPGVSGFEWDEGNSDKNWRRHRVTQAEAEQGFFNRPILLAPDREHSAREVRCFALGQTNAGHALAIVFTLRGAMLRVISARPMSRRERRAYAHARGA
jgi:hypothetical protein